MKPKKENSIVAEVSIVPLEGGTSVSSSVRRAVGELKSSGLKTSPTAMGTILEADNLDDILSAVKRAHESLFEAGSKRVLTSLKIDERRDKPHTIDSKMRAIGPRRPKT
jgi:uncharacterized protein (TIGR00106 family)